MRKCTIAKKCGGCQFINEGYQASLDYKNRQCQKLFKDFTCQIHPVIGMENPYGYRNKVIVAFNQRYEYGLYHEESHRIVPYEHCLLHDDETDAIIKKIAQLFRKYHTSIYDEKKRRGDIRHVLIRRAVQTNQTLVTLVSSNPVFKGSKNFCRLLMEAFPSVKTVVLNINRRQTSIVLGNTEKVLAGKGYIIDELCGLKFKISSQSFYQINHDQCVALYRKAISLLPKKQKVIYDTYCGIGTIGMISADKAQQVIGIEKNREAVKDANTNKKFNHVNNIQFINDDATAFMTEAAAHKEKVSTIIMDPPRSGSTPEFIKAAASLKPSHILYISCGPETQVRDLKLFKKLGYTFSDVYPFDMFPFTNHVETVVLMSRATGIITA